VNNISDILKNRKFVKDTHNTYEFQAYGNRIAEEFNDMEHRSLYIKLAKTENRNLMEVAREFVMRSENATTKGKLFMWKLTELKKKTKDSTI
jgi:hypothetical protein